MPTLQRSIVGINSLLYNELRKRSLEEPEGAAFLDNAEITADYTRPHRQSITAELSYRGKVIWRRAIPLTWLDVETNSMSDQQIMETVTGTMRKHLNLIAQMHFARLEPMFPGSIDEVTMGFDPKTNTKTIYVKFKNGHVAEGPEGEAKDEIFLARCAMLYDLPPL